MSGQRVKSVYIIPLHDDGMGLAVKIDRENTIKENVHEDTQRKKK